MVIRLYFSFNSLPLVPPPLIALFSRPTLSRYAKTGKLWNNLYIFKICSSSTDSLNFKVPLINKYIMPKNDSIKGFTVEVSDNEGNIIYKFNSISIAANTLGISRHTVRYNADRGKLWKDKYFFKLIPND